MSSTNSNKEVRLTTNEQRVYIEVLKNKVSTLKDVTEVTGNYHTSRDTMSRLVSKGYALRVHRGYYAGIPPEYLNTNYEIDRYVIAHKVSNLDGTLAYHSALELHGVAQSYFNTVYYLRQKPLKTFRFQGIEYRYLRSEKLFGLTQIMREGIPLPVTDKERTFLDCIRRQDYCGGLEEMLKSLSTFHTLDVQKLDKYLNKYNEQSLLHKAGFVLSLMQDEMRIPESYLTQLRKKLKEKTYYLEPRAKSGSGQLVSGWNIIVPKNLEEVMRFA